LRKNAGKAQFSPVALAIFVIFGVSTGAILLNSGVLLSEQALGGGGEATSGGPLAGVLSSSLTDSLVVDEKTKLLLNATFAVLGLGAVLIGDPPPFHASQRDAFPIICLSFAQRQDE